jgi:hypothetical protein
MKRRTPPVGELNPRVKISFQIAEQIRDKYANSQTSYKQLALQFDLSVSQIIRIIKRKVWAQQINYEEGQKCAEIMQRTNKKCSKCNLQKQLSEFNLCRHNKDLHSHKCRECTRKEQKVAYNKICKVGRIKYVPVYKICTLCMQKKNIDSFHQHKWSTDGYLARCKSCIRKVKNAKNYGLSVRDYETLVSQYQNQCMICGTAPSKRSLDVDHNHKTGQIRGLLCSRCNLCVGALEEDIELINKISDYLSFWQFRALEDHTKTDETAVDIEEQQEFTGEANVD